MCLYNMCTLLYFLYKQNNIYKKENEYLIWFQEKKSYQYFFKRNEK